MTERLSSTGHQSMRHRTKRSHLGLAMPGVVQTTVVALFVVVGVTVSARAVPTLRVPASLSPVPGFPAFHELWAPSSEDGYSGATSQGVRAASQEVREILDAYCRILMLAKSLGKINHFTETKERELLELKGHWGFDDPRNTESYKDCDICANDIFRESWQDSGVERKAFDPPPPMPANATNPDADMSSAAAQGADNPETLVRMITDQVMESLRK